MFWLVVLLLGVAGKPASASNSTWDLLRSCTREAQTLLQPDDLGGGQDRVVLGTLTGSDVASGAAVATKSAE